MLQPKADPLQLNDAPAARRSDMPSVGVVGYGYWGPNLVRNFVESGECNLKYVCDIIDENRARAVLRFPSVTATACFDQMIYDSSLDAVVIATPVKTHYPLAAKAIRAGKHVMIEKPLAASSDEARSLMALAGEQGVILMAGHTFEFSAPVLKIKELIDSGELGDIHYITSKRVNLGLYQHDVSVIWDLGPHDFSILFKWLDQEPLLVSAMGRRCIGHDHPDVAFINLEFPSGIVAEVQLSWLSPVKLRRTMVVGSKKMLLYDDTDNVEPVKVFDHGVGFDRAPENFGEFQLSYRFGDVVSPKLPSYEPLSAQVKHFLRCVRDGVSPETDGESGLRVVRALEAAESSLAKKGCATQPGRAA